MLFSTFLFVFSISKIALAAPLAKRTASANTMLVLQFASVLEQLETTFYQQALSKFQASDFTDAGFVTADVPVQQFNVIVGDESTHANILSSTIDSFGGTPITSCQFDFSSVLTDVKTMASVARLVENVGVSAYMGAAALVDDPQILTAAASILTVEARHQTMLNLLNGGSTISSAFDMALSPSQVLAIAGGFISGCDLGVPANPALTVTNTGPIGVGTQLTFSSPAITGDTTNLTCQMMVGGAPFAISLPFDNCVVPSGINGLVYLYIVNTDQPLLADLTVQNSASIVAGPTGAFIDTQPEAVSQMLFTNSGNTGGGSNGGSGGSGGNADTVITTTTISPDAASSIAASLATATSAPAPTGTGDGAVVPTPAPANVGGNSTAPVTGEPNLATGPMGPVNVIGWSSVPAQ